MKCDPARTGVKGRHPDDAKVIGTWADGSPAVTVREYGNGKAFAVGTLPGHAYINAAAKITPWARCGRRMVYPLMTHDPLKNKLINLAIAAKPELGSVSKSPVKPMNFLVGDGMEASDHATP